MRFLCYKFWPIFSSLVATRPLWANKGGLGAEDLDGCTEIKNGLQSLEGTRTDQLDPILSLLGPYTRSHGSY